MSFVLSIPAFIARISLSEAKDRLLSSVITPVHHTLPSQIPICPQESEDGEEEYICKAEADLCNLGQHYCQSTRTSNKATRLQFAVYPETAFTFIHGNEAQCDHPKASSALHSLKLNFATG